MSTYKGRARKLPQFPVGHRFGEWKVFGPEIHKDKHYFFQVRCSCGREKVVNGWDLHLGYSSSCMTCAAAVRRTTHGLTDTVEFNVWLGIRKRCHNNRAREWKNYGGRGIKLCARWRDSFEAFLADMGHRPSPAHSIDRIDNDGNYEPGNCRWATRSQQASNTRQNRIVTYRGERMTITEMARRIGCQYMKLRYCIVNRGMEPEEAAQWSAPSRSIQA